MPLSVYLDSSDYSVLSDPARAAREAPGVLEKLQRLKDLGNVEFFYSAAHLTEMAPTQPGFTDAARRRGNLLVELCGNNCMIHNESLFRSEISVALNRTSTAPIVFDRTGKWFQDGQEMSPISAVGHLRSLKISIAEILPNASRSERRQVERKLAKGGNLRPAAHSALIKQANEGDLKEALDAFPMREDAARVLARYVVGDASAAEATTAYESCLRDPRWMMQWFEKHHDKIAPFIAWARVQAPRITEQVLKQADLVMSMRANLHLTKEHLDSMLSPVAWEELQDKMLMEIASAIAKSINAKSNLDIVQVDKCCPGLSTAIRSLHSAWHSITFLNQRRPKESDFVDALHAAYAPYVDVFRADGFMSSYVAKQVKRFGTTVVPKLLSLPDILERRCMQA